jgi:hypothetical protein
MPATPVRADAHGNTNAITITPTQTPAARACAFARTLISPKVAM